MKENRRTNDGIRKASRLRSAGELVFMAPPTLACDGPQEDSIECVPVLYVAITNQRWSLDQQTRVEEQMFGSDITTVQHLRGSGTAIESRQKSRMGGGTASGGATSGGRKVLVRNPRKS